MPKDLMKRGLSQVRKLWTHAAPEKAELSDKETQKILALLHDCAANLGGEVSTRQRAARLGEIYMKLGDAGRKNFLSLIVHEFGPDPKKVEAAHNAWQQASGTPAQWNAEAALRAALRSPRLRILTQFNALPQGVKFLVDLRSDLLRYMKNDPALAALDRELENRFGAWFDVGFLELKRLTWHTPAAVLETLIRYEAVHEIRSWADLKNRLDSDRRCYGFFHPRMPDDPLIFVEVALVNDLADNVQSLLDEQAPIFDVRRANTAIFYSISNTQTGLRGVSFGHFLLKRVIDDLQQDLPRLSTFATLSPLPGLRRWAQNNEAAWRHAIDDSELARIAKAVEIEAQREALAALLERPRWFEDERLKRLLQTPLTRLAANYLVNAKRIAPEKGERPLDPVASFHLGNGARVERLNYLGDTSEKGLAQSYGMMVNYLYDPDNIERNIEALLQEGKIDQSANVRRAAKGAATS
ncbi:MAG: malonyl-CoA decarboxylase [Azonexus sp.]|jgi:malonyl-CoA decarboxylase|uniref:malonyl-CoA decarboxylase n=1 Tax=Azonexus sp. TaxID=1872668 RepID=UPI002839F788|nr:malonyl-CoA decarboxylase [Azonexus sp.]MDR0775070.1 malonyl-CoA decarboxylase [Azonexus sp.]MDR1995383.1 malonyl-CoA decarboxylase [Azonexus sp.]